MLLAETWPRCHVVTKEGLVNRTVVLVHRICAHPAN